MGASSVALFELLPVQPPIMGLGAAAAIIGPQKKTSSTMKFGITVGIVRTFSTFELPERMRPSRHEGDPEEP